MFAAEVRAMSVVVLDLTGSGDWTGGRARPEACFPCTAKQAGRHPGGALGCGDGSWRKLSGQARVSPARQELPQVVPMNDHPSGPSDDRKLAQSDRRYRLQVDMQSNFEAC